MEMESSALGGRTILVVEAEPSAALQVEAGLREAGARVFGAHRLRDALHMAEHPALSAAVIAQRLGSDSTSAVCRRLADLGVPFMLYTRHDAAEARQKWPAAPVVAKSASTRELINAVAELMH
jgi:DNA-binding response OmpR family regulator